MRRKRHGWVESWLQEHLGSERQMQQIQGDSGGQLGWEVEGRRRGGGHLTAQQANASYFGHSSLCSLAKSGNLHKIVSHESQSSKH